MTAAYIDVVTDLIFAPFFNWTIVSHYNLSGEGWFEFFMFVVPMPLVFYVVYKFVDEYISCR